MPRPTIYYIRHGETEWNALGRLQGTQDIPLNALGRVQAVQAGNILSQLVARNGHDAMRLPYVASPLSRARATMELVRETLQLPVEDYALDARLREIGYGKWEGATLPEMQAADPVFYAKRLTEKWTLAPEGGETYADVERRVRDWYDQLTGDIVAVESPCYYGTMQMRRRPWRHGAGADGRARLRNAEPRRRPADPAGRGVCVRRGRLREVQLACPVSPGRLAEAKPDSRDPGLHPGMTVFPIG